VPTAFAVLVTTLHVLQRDRYVLVTVD